MSQKYSSRGDERDFKITYSSILFLNQDTEAKPGSYVSSRVLVWVSISNSTDIDRQINNVVVNINSLHQCFLYFTKNLKDEAIIE